MSPSPKSEFDYDVEVISKKWWTVNSKLVGYSHFQLTGLGAYDRASSSVHSTGGHEEDA